MEQIKFKINDEIFSLTVPQEDEDNLIFQLINDDEFTVTYIKELIENGYLYITDQLKSIHRLEGDEHKLLYPTDLTQRTEEPQSCRTTEWSDGETRLLLTDYEQLVSKVGPMKKFKTKKVMWSHIAANISATFNSQDSPRRTGLQVENRYKIVMKRKKSAVENNSRSGASRMVPYKDELSKIAALDDSVEPEILRSSKEVRILKQPSATTLQDAAAMGHLMAHPQQKGRLEKTIQETLVELHRLKEEARELRHQEKLALIREILQSKQTEAAREDK